MVCPFSLQCAAERLTTWVAVSAPEAGTGAEAIAVKQLLSVGRLEKVPVRGQRWMLRTCDEAIEWWRT